MKKKVLKFPESSIVPALTRYDHTSHPADFLDAVEETFRDAKPLAQLTARLDGFIKTVAATNDRTPIFLKACRLLAKFNFSEAPRPTRRVEMPSVGTMSDAARASVESLGNALRSIEERQETLSVKGASTPYAAYPPAYPYVDAILKVFDDSDPVKVVCEYLDALQPGEWSHHPDDCWFDDDDRITVSATAGHFYLSKVFPQLFPCQSIVEGSPSEIGIASWTAAQLLIPYFHGALGSVAKKQPIFDHTFPTGKTIDKFSDSDAASLLQSFQKGLSTFDGFLFFFFSNYFAIPQGLFVAVLRYWLDSKVEIAESDASRSILRNLVNFPLGRPAQSWEEVSIGVTDPAWLENAKQIYKAPELVPFLPCGMSYGDWFTPLFESYLPHQIRWDYSDGFASLVLDAWSKKISLLRNSHLGGRYPWRVRRVDRFLYDDYEVSSPDWDTHLQFLALFIEGDAEWEWTDDIYGDNYANRFRSFRFHRNFWLAARREGYPELGNALFAFYLLRKSILDARQHPHLEVDWPMFSDHLRSALTEPGHKWVRKATELMKAVCKEKKWNIDLLRLKNVLPDSGAIIPLPVSTSFPSVDPVGAKVSRDFERLVGTDRWNRFSITSRKLLVQAELRYQEIVRSIDGGITEFGPEILAYARPFENELNERLQHIYDSSEVKEWWSERYPTRPSLSKYLTLGSHLKFLESNPPTNVARLIEAAGVTLHRNPKLIGRLKRLKDRRDKGAHPSNADTLSLLQGQHISICNEDLLRDFLSALSRVDPQRPPARAGS